MNRDIIEFSVRMKDLQKAAEEMVEAIKEANKTLESKEEIDDIDIVLGIVPLSLYLSAINTSGREAMSLALKVIEPGKDLEE